jgi:hypothetical protein
MLKAASVLHTVVALLNPAFGAVVWLTVTVAVAGRHGGMPVTV